MIKKALLYIAILIPFVLIYAVVGSFLEHNKIITHPAYWVLYGVLYGVFVATICNLIIEKVIETIEQYNRNKNDTSKN